LTRSMSGHVQQQQHGVDTAAAAAAGPAGGLRSPQPGSTRPGISAGASSGGSSTGSTGSDSSTTPCWIRVFTEEYEGRHGYTRRFLAASYKVHCSAACQLVTAPHASHCSSSAVAAAVSETSSCSIPQCHLLTH
jgi:hypothetical protein